MPRLRSSGGLRPLIHVSESSGQRHVSACAKRGIGCSSFIVPFDGDDIFLPGRVQRQVDALERSPEVAGVYGKAKRINGDGSELGTSVGFSFSSFYLPFSNPICHGASMMRRSAISEAGEYLDTGHGTDSVAEDYFLWLRMGQQRKFLFENEFRYFYRCHGRQTSRRCDDRHDACVNYSCKQVLDANQLIVDQFMRGGVMSFSRSDIPRVMLVLGLLCRGLDPRSVGHQSIVKIAEQLDPDDYGVLIRKHIQLTALGDAPGALRQCALLRERYPRDLFLCMVACDHEIALLRQMSITSQEKLADIMALRDGYARRFHQGPVAIDT